MEFILESAAWVALGFITTLLALEAGSKSRELSIKIAKSAELGRRKYTTMGGLASA